MSSVSCLPESSGSSLTIQFKLRQIWNKIRHSNPSLVSLVDVENVTNTALIILEQINLDTKNIMKKLGVPINLRLVQMESKFYVHLTADDAKIWAEMLSSKDDKEAIDIMADTEEAAETFIENSDDSVTLGQNILQAKEWPKTVYSIIKTALENFSTKPRYSKEACVLHSPSSVIESTLAIARGEVLCIKIYRPRLGGIALTPFYHFGVYVGTITTNDGVELQDAVIELCKHNKTGEITIRAVPLVGNEKGKCFVFEKPNTEHPPLLFKLMCKDRTQKEKNETADRALHIYKNADSYLNEYDLLSNNCEHFVNICAFGTPHCEQRVGFLLTTIPNFFKASPVIAKIARYIFIVLGEVAESALRQSNILLNSLGESVALGMLVIEFIFRLIWDIYLLKKSGRLTVKNIGKILKIRFVPILPELLVGIGFLLIAVLCAVSGPIGLIIGISGAIIMLILRFTTRPRIQRWIERREAARREDFLQWHPREVSRLAMETSEEENTHKDLLADFEKRKLSGKAIIELVKRERESPSEKPLSTILEFLDPIRLNRFKQNLKGILGHFDISEELKSSIDLTYQEWSLTIETSYFSDVTVRQLLDMARLNWKINFVKGQWQLTNMDSEDGKKHVIASYTMSNSIEKKICTIPDSPTKLELSYQKSSQCSLL